MFAFLFSGQEGGCVETIHSKKRMGYCLNSVNHSYLTLRTEGNFFIKSLEGAEGRGAGFVGLYADADQQLFQNYSLL